MLIRPYLCHSSLAIRMLARKRLAGASRCAQAPFPLDFTTSSLELAIGLTPPRVDPLANPVLSPLLQTVRGAGPLPRLHRRGPIEAPPSADRDDRPTCLFHGFIAVAPLKLFLRSPTSSLRPLFHGFIAVAPLKRFWCRQGHGSPHTLPRLHRRGPIEASPVRTISTVSGASSTASSPWPH